MHEVELNQNKQIENMNESIVLIEFQYRLREEIKKEFLRFNITMFTCIKSIDFFS